MTELAQDTATAGAAPHFGHTAHGLPVHLRVSDYHAAATRYQQFNRKLAMWITDHIGTMNCFWLFTVLSLLSLPATLHLAGFRISPLYAVIPAFLLTFGWIEVITWVCQNYVQLVLLPALMVGQNLQNVAADARASKTFEDVEAVRVDLRSALDLLNVETTGGLQVIKALLDPFRTDTLRQMKALKESVDRIEAALAAPGK